MDSLPLNSSPLSQEYELLLGDFATLQNFCSKMLTPDRMAGDTWIWYNNSRKHQVAVEGVLQCLQC